MRYLLVFFLLYLNIAIHGQPSELRHLDFNYSDRINCLEQDNRSYLWIGTDNGIYVYNSHSFAAVRDLMDKSITSLSCNGDLMLVGTRNGEVYQVDIMKGMRPRLISKHKGEVKNIIFRDENKILVNYYGEGIHELDINNNKVDKIIGLNSDDVYDMVKVCNNSYAFATDDGLLIGSLNKNYLKAKSIENLPDFVVIDVEYDHNTKTIFGKTLDGSLFKVDSSFSRVERLAKLDDRLAWCNLKQYQSKLFYLKGSSLMHYSNQNPIVELNFSFDKINHLFIDKMRTLWLVVDNSKIVYKNLFINNWLSFPKNEIQTFVISGTTSYLGTQKGLYEKNNSLKPILSNESISKLNIIGDLLWIGTFSNGLYLYDLKSKKIKKSHFLNKFEENTILDIEAISANEIEVSTLSGVITYDLAGQRSESKAKINDAYIYDIFKTSNGTVLYGTDRRGLIIRNQEKFIRVDSIIINGKYQKIGSVYSICEDEKKTLFMACSNLGIIKLTGSTYDLIYPPDHQNQEFNSLIYLGNNSLMAILSNKHIVIDIDKKLVTQLDGKERSIKKNENFINNYYAGLNEVFIADENLIYSVSKDIANLKLAPKVILEKVENNYEEVIDNNSFNHDENNLRFTFNKFDMLDRSSNEFYYKLDGFDIEWRQTFDNQVSYPHLPSGKYKFLLSSYKDNQDLNGLTSYEFSIEKPFYKKWSIILLTLIIAGGSINYLIKKRNKEKELSKKLIETELISLRSQLNPHFLFNTLNTLIALIEENPQRGVKFTQSLTDFFRKVAQTNHLTVITLEKELEIINNYYSLIKERFGEALILNIDESVDKYLLTYIPPLTLQILVENAIKHNEVSRSKKLYIDIEAKNGNIVVSNNINQKIGQIESLGIGQKNIIERFKLLKIKEPYFEQTNNEYKFYLPLIHNK